MSKIALLPDVHVGARGDSPVFQELHKKSFAWFFSEIDQRRIKYVIQLGDLFDRRKFLNFKSANIMREHFLDPLSKRDITSYVIAGNHDCYHKDSNYINALEEIVGTRYKGINIYTKPAEINIDGLDIQLLPWIAEEDYEQSLEVIRKSKSEILMGHLELQGFEMHKGSICEHGMDSALLSRFDSCFSGHFHHRSANHNIQYIGCFVGLTWSDYNDARGFAIFDTETRKLEFLDNPYTVFKLYHYDDVKDQKIMDTIMAYDPSELKDCYVKVIVANKTNPYALDTLISKIEGSSPVDISIVENVISLDFDLEENDDSELEAVDDTPKILDNYIDGLSLSLDGKKMKNFMRKVYAEALALEDVE